MNLSELENMSFLTNEALKDTTIEFDLDENGNQVSKISFQDAVDLFKKGYKYRDKEIKKLKQENKKLKDALGFYADENNWNRSNKCLFNRVNIFDVELTKNKTVKEVYYKNLEVGGKLARQTLKEIEESK